MLVSSTSSLSSGSVQPPASGVPPQTEARGWQAEGERGWKHARLGQALLPSGRNRAGCCSHEQERVRAMGRAHMVYPHPRTTAPARTPTACGGAPGRRSTRQRGRRPAPRRPAGAEANACTPCRAARRWHCGAGAGRVGEEVPAAHSWLSRQGGAVLAVLDGVIYSRGGSPVEIAPSILQHSIACKASCNSKGNRRLSTPPSVLHLVRCRRASSQPSLYLAPFLRHGQRRL